MIFRWLRFRRPLSQAWLRDNIRRENAQGIDQSRISQWPMKKVLNENPLWNTRKLRKTA